MDLVERLREFAAEMNGYTPEICREAADEIERLRDALAPFAKMADHYVRHHGNHAVMQVSTHEVGDAEITVGDFQAAHAALSR